MKLNNKTIIVTGGGSGIGRELVLALLQRGARVAAVDMNPATLDETSKLAGAKSDRLSLHVLNIVDKAGVFQLPAQILEKHNSIDGVINNAGIIQPFVKVQDLEDAAIEKVMNVNFYGLLNLTRALLPHLLKRPEAHIVNISSMGGFLPVPGQSIYGASKAAVKLLTEGLRSELLSTGVKVTIVFPGAIGTNIAANSGINIEGMSAENSSFKMLSSVKAAKIILDGMEKDRYRILVGSDAKFMDFLYRLTPKFAAEFIYRQMRSLLK